MCTTDTTSDLEPIPLTDKVTAGSQGLPTKQAAAIIITEALGGRLLDQVVLASTSPDWAVIDWPTTLETTGYLSGGERKLIAIAASLGSGVPVDLADTLSGLDSTNGRLVLEAVAVAVGFNRPPRPGGDW